MYVRIYIYIHTSVYMYVYIYMRVYFWGLGFRVEEIEVVGLRAQCPL